MVKVGVLIVTILTAIGAFLQALYFSVVASNSETYLYDGNWDDISFLELQYFAAFLKADGTQINIVPIAFMIYNFGLVLIFIMTMGSKKVFIIIGGLLCSLCSLGIMFMWFTGEIYSNAYKGMNAGFLLGMILYFVGLITYRKHFKLGIWLTGPLMLIIAIVSNGVFGVGFTYDIETFDPYFTESMINTHLILQSAQGLIMVLHGFLFSFSKKKLDEEEGEEELSVEKGQAFQSYVPEEMKKDKKGKEKKPAKSEEIEWKF